MKLYTATIKEDAFEPRSSHAYYTRQKLLVIALVTLVSVIPLIGISLFSFQYYRSSWTDDTAAGLATSAGDRQEVIERFLADQNNLLTGIMNLYPPEYLSQQDNLERIFNATNQSGVITDLGVIDAGGNHLAYVGPFEQQLAGVNYAGTDWFAQAMQQGQYTSDIFSGFRGVPHFVMAVANQERTIILRATINSDMFNSLLASADVGPNGDAFILNRAGDAQTPSRLGSLATPFALDSLTGNAASTVFQTDDFIYAAASLNQGQWILVLKEDVNASLAGFYSARNKAIALIILAIVIIASVATLLASSIIDRIKLADEQRLDLNSRMQNVEKMALVGRLAAGVSHEINNPLQIIDNQAGWIGELLEDEKEGRVGEVEEYQDAVDKIRFQVKRAKGITHGLLGFARSGDEQLQRTNINGLVRETVSFMESTAEEKGIVIKRDLQENLPRIQTDPAKLQQVFLNIINNAIDAIGRDGAITVTTRTGNGNAVLAEFADTGPGLRDGAQKKIFDPFYTTKDSQNTGLGLSISYNIIQRLGGDIEARNQEQGGSVFTVTLPAGSEDEAQKPQE